MSNTICIYFVFSVYCELRTKEQIFAARFVFRGIYAIYCLLNTIFAILFSNDKIFTWISFLLINKKKKDSIDIDDFDSYFQFIEFETQMPKMF